MGDGTRYLYQSQQAWTLDGTGTKEEEAQSAPSQTLFMVVMTSRLGSSDFTRCDSLCLKFAMNDRPVFAARVQGAMFPLAHDLAKFEIADGTVVFWHRFERTD